MVYRGNGSDGGRISKRNIARPRSSFPSRVLCRQIAPIGLYSQTDRRALPTHSRQLLDQRRRGGTQIESLAALLGCRDHLRRKGGSSYVLPEDILDPTRFGHKRVARYQSVQLHCPLHLAHVCQKQGHRSQQIHEWFKGLQGIGRPQRVTEALPGPGAPSQPEVNNCRIAD
jgi:hypothetical protein